MSMSYKMEIIEDQDEGGFVISYPDLPGCITCGETIESAMQNAKGSEQHWKREQKFMNQIAWKIILDNSN